MSNGSSRWRHFLMMVPAFLIGVGLTVYFFGFTGDGPPRIGDPEATYTTAPPDDTIDQPQSQRTSRGFGIVAFMRNLFESTVDNWVSPSLSPLTVKLGLLAVIFAAGFFVVRVIIALVSGALGGFFGFLIHKAAAPMFYGFLAVGSTWGIHQTVAEQFGTGWAAATISITMAIATLFALAGVRVRG